MQTAKSIETNQLAPHEGLVELVTKYQASEFQRPIAAHTQQAFADMLDFLQAWSGNVIIDACCGVGESTLHIAQSNPDTKVIGIDKSSHRLAKHDHYLGKINENDSKHQNDVENCLILQADLLDFWRLLLQKLEEGVNWQVVKQYILYPNPYPKKSQLNKRWHASAIFPYVVKICSDIEVRSNWLIYLQEFQQAMDVYGFKMAIKQVDSQPITPFERKYLQSNQICYRACTLADGEQR